MSLKLDFFIQTKCFISIFGLLRCLEGLAVASDRFVLSRLFCHVRNFG